VRETKNSGLQSEFALTKTKKAHRVCDSFSNSHEDLGAPSSRYVESASLFIIGSLIECAFGIRDNSWRMFATLLLLMQRIVQF